MHNNDLFEFRLWLDFWGTVMVVLVLECFSYINLFLDLTTSLLLHGSTSYFLFLNVGFYTLYIVFIFLNELFFMPILLR